MDFFLKEKLKSRFFISKVEGICKEQPKKGHPTF